MTAFSDLVARQPSLAYVLGRLAGAWVEGDEMIPCPLPGHEDKVGSFNLWIPRDSDQPRWGCFGCGRKGGDAVSLIEALNGVDEAEAIRLARELAAAEENDGERPKPELVRRTLLISIPDKLAELRQETGLRELAALERFLADKGLGANEGIARFVMDRWDWVPAARGIAIPHFGPDGAAVGIRYRGADYKSSQPGSKYDYLYGTWLDDPSRPRVLLCEGETDTVWGAWSLRDDPAVTVLGLPSGAGQKIRPEWLEQIGERELVLALDSDEAGMAAAREWREARPDALLARIPEGKDLLDCRIPVVELLGDAQRPPRLLDLISSQDGMFAVQAGRGGQLPVSDFSFRPTRELKADDGPAWDVQLEGRHGTVLLRASDFASQTSFTRWANRNGGAWLGKSSAVQALYNWTRSESAYLPLERVTTRAGRIGRSFVGPGFCIGRDRVRYIPPAYGDPKLESRLHVEQGDWDAQAVLALESLNSPRVMAGLLGWLTASLLRGRRAPAPPLFVSGESGAGKTNMLAALLGAFGFGIEANLTSTTPYGVDCLVNGCVGFPVWFDEYRGGARRDSMERLRQLLRDAYYGQPSMKGGMTGNLSELAEVQTWAGIVVSGEMSSHETSHRDRILMVDLDPRDRNAKALAFLQDRRRTAGLAYDLLAFLADRPAPEIAAGDRFKSVLGFVQSGWEAWLAFRDEHGIGDPPEGPDLARFAGERKDVDDPWLEAIRASEGVFTKDGDLIVQQTAEGVVMIPSEVIREGERAGIELPAQARELVAWLRNRWTVQDVRIGAHRRAKLVKEMVL